MSKVKADVLANRLDTKEVPVETAIAGSAKAWVNFTGLGTVAIRDSFNVAGIVDVNVGIFSVTYTNPVDTNHVTVMNAALGGATTLYCSPSDGLQSTLSSDRYSIKTDGGTATDPDRAYFVAFSN